MADIACRQTDDDHDCQQFQEGVNAGARLSAQATRLATIEGLEGLNVAAAIPAPERCAEPWFEVAK